MFSEVRQESFKDHSFGGCAALPWGSRLDLVATTGCKQDSFGCKDSFRFVSPSATWEGSEAYGYKGIGGERTLGLCPLRVRREPGADCGSHPGTQPLMGSRTGKANDSAAFALCLRVYRHLGRFYAVYSPTS